MSEKNEEKLFTGGVNDEQAVRKSLSKDIDHEMANEPLSTAERIHNKKTKKRQ
jgi:small acid-soluble spore protein O (minor)